MTLVPAAAAAAMMNLDLVITPDTAWYPTMRLFRQGESERWAALFIRMPDELMTRSWRRSIHSN